MLAAGLTTSDDGRDWPSPEAQELTAALEAVDGLAAWSPWTSLRQAAALAAQLPGVYMAREGAAGPVVYVGMAGERRGRGVRGRLTVYTRGKGLVSGLGEAAMDRALADADWLRHRLAEVHAGEPRRAKEWGQLALQRADLHVRWATTPDRDSALALERSVLSTLTRHELWNRLR